MQIEGIIRLLLPAAHIMDLRFIDGQKGTRKLKVTAYSFQPERLLRLKFNVKLADPLRQVSGHGGRKAGAAVAC